MFITCGVDIIEIDRIKSSIEELGDHFLNKVYTKKEIEYCESKKVQKYQHYAARFAAKEAIFKALSENIDDKYSICWKDFEVLNDEKGRPYVQINGINTDNIENIDISISHCKQYAVANVTILCKCPFRDSSKIDIKLFDSHSHLNDEKFDEDREELIKEIIKNDNFEFVTAGYNLEGSKKAIDISNKYKNIYATCGISPNDIPQNEDKLWKELKEIEELAKNNKEKVVAIGEIGLDYYWNVGNKDIQKKVFIEQIKIANRLNLPIVIHTRDAICDTLQILKENNVEKKGVFHCCPQNRELIKEAVRLGFYISFAGPITFKNSKNSVEMINLVPNDKILIETDSPYLAPEPVRGTRNNPSNVKFVAQKIADAKKLSLEEVAKITRENTYRIFEI